MLLRNGGKSLLRQILCAHGCSYEHCHHLGCDTVRRGTNRLTRRTNLLFPSSGTTCTCCYDKHASSFFRVNIYPLLRGAQNVMGAAQQISTKFHDVKQSHFLSTSIEYMKTKFLTPKYRVQGQQLVNVPEVITRNRVTFYNPGGGGPSSGPQVGAQNPPGRQ